MKEDPRVSLPPPQFNSTSLGNGRPNFIQRSLTFNFRCKGVIDPWQPNQTKQTGAKMNNNTSPGAAAAGTNKWAWSLTTPPSPLMKWETHTVLDMLNYSRYITARRPRPVPCYTGGRRWYKTGREKKKQFHFQLWIRNELKKKDRGVVRKHPGRPQSSSSAKENGSEIKNRERQIPGIYKRVAGFSLSLKPRYPELQSINRSLKKGSEQIDCGLLL